MRQKRAAGTGGGEKTIRDIRLPTVRSPRAWPRRGSSPRCWSASTATTRRSIARPRSSPGTASGSTARPWRAGSAARAGGWSRCRRALPPMSSRRPSCSPTTHLFRYSILAVEEPRPGGSPVDARDDRPWAGPEPPAAVYFYSPDRKAVRPASHLEGFPWRAAGRWRSLSSGRSKAGPGGRVRDARCEG